MQGVAVRMGPRSFPVRACLAENEDREVGQKRN